MPLKETIQIVGEPIDELPEKTNHLFVPKYYTWSIKHIICKLITHDSDWIKVANYKRREWFTQSYA